MSTAEVKDEITAAVLQEGARLQQEFKEASAELLDRVVRQEALLHAHQKRLDDLQSRFGRMDAARETWCDIDLGLDSADAIAKTCLRCDRMEEQLSELRDQVAKCTTEMRCDRLEKQLNEMRQSFSALQFQAKGAEWSNEEKDACIVDATGTGPSTPEARRMMKAMDDEYEFQENVWDLALFIGFPQLGRLGSICSAFLALANTVLQLLLVGIINNVFTEHEINEETAMAMRRWRVFFGHSYTLADKLTFESLSSRVCKQDPSVPYADGVLSIIQEISEYIPTRGDYHSKELPYGHWFHIENVGSFLCISAIVIWLLEIITSCDKQWQLACTIMRLPTCQAPKVHSSECLAFEEDGTITLRRLSQRRKIWCSILVVLQFVVILPLAAMGTAMLIATTNMRDLLLNCSALTLVIQTDELFFSALATRQGKILMKALNPLPRIMSRTHRGLNWEVPFYIACMVVTIGVSVVPLNALVKDLRDTLHEVCGGRRDFIAVRDQAGVISAGLVDLAVDDTSTYYWDAMRSLVTDQNAVRQTFAQSGTGTVSGMTSSIWSLQATRDFDVDEVMSYWNADCNDMLSVGTYSQYMLRILKDAAQDTSIRNCTDVVTACSTDNLMGTRSRQFCPYTCGCKDRSSSLILDGVIGCPPSCSRSTAYNDSMWSKPCVDEVLNSTYWDRMIAGLRSLQASYPLNWVTDFDDSIQTLRDHGCRVISDKLPLPFVGANWSDPCVTSPAKVKSLIFACPVACGCHTKYRPGCPMQCQAAALGR